MGQARSNSFPCKRTAWWAGCYPRLLSNLCQCPLLFAPQKSTSCRPPGALVPYVDGIALPAQDPSFLSDGDSLMSRSAMLLNFALALGACVLLGCTASGGAAGGSDAGGTSSAPINTGTLGGGGSGGDQSDGGSSGDDGDGGDTSSNGMDGESPDDPDSIGSNGMDDGGDTTPLGTPVVTLAIGDLAPSAGQTVFLNCVVTDSGGSPATQFEYVSTAGGGEIVQDGSSIASATIPPGLVSINYQCRATNAAGTGAFSPIATVNIGG